MDARDLLKADHLAAHALAHGMAHTRAKEAVTTTARKRLHSDGANDGRCLMTPPGRSQGEYRSAKHAGLPSTTCCEVTLQNRSRQ